MNANIFYFKRNLVAAAAGFLVVIASAACQSPPQEPTPDIPATVTAQVERSLVSQATPTPAPTRTPLPPMVVQVTPSSPTRTPVPTPTETPTPAPTATPAPAPTDTPSPTPTQTATPAPEPTIKFTQQELDEAEEKRQFAGILWYEVAKACTDNKYSGRRKQSDIQSLLVSQEIQDQMMAEFDDLPHHEEMTPVQRLQAVKIFRAATTKLLDICLPPGVELGGD